jgi:hypothetical protein
MSITTTFPQGATTLTLDHPLVWENEFNWDAVKHTRRTTVTGAQVVQAQARQAGRPVTLASGGWVRRAQLLQLQAWRDQPGLVLQISPRGGTPFGAAWDHEAGAIEAELVHASADPDVDDYYRVTLRLFSV